MMKTVFVCALIVAAAHCDVVDNVKNAAAGVGDFFGDKFGDFKSLFANNEADLEKNVQSVKGLLTTIASKASVLKPLANDAQKAALSKVGEMTSQVDNFQNKMKTDAGQTFEEKKSEWAKLVQKLFQAEGLSKLIELVKSTGNGVSPMLATTLSFIVPLVLVFRY
ncbi:unnamed protein product [Anisakis simplex]|uniref:Secreted protein n=1 Tax=Anisakis simplex TaxID=6269 RepID=A0A0M3K064_ANISI|nr:unnamed protein product [Anisakis simplex]